MGRRDRGPVMTTVESAWPETCSIWAGRGSTQSQVRVFTADGRLVASRTVQAIVRSLGRRPHELGQGCSTVM